MSFRDFLVETTLSRINQHFEKGDAIAIISGERDELKRLDKDKNAREIRKYLRDANFGYVKAVGGYTELKNDGAKVNVNDEHSTIIFASPDRADELFSLVKSLGIKYSQDTILFVDTKGKAKWYATRNDSTIGKIGSTKDLGYFHFRQIDKYYTKIGKQRFSFKLIDESADVFSKPSTIQMMTREHFRKVLKRCAKSGEDFFTVLNG